MTLNLSGASEDFLYCAIQMCVLVIIIIFYAFKKFFALGSKDPEG